MTIFYENKTKIDLKTDDDGTAAEGRASECQTQARTHNRNSRRYDTDDECRRWKRSRRERRTRNGPATPRAQHGGGVPSPPSPTPRPSPPPTLHPAPHGTTTIIGSGDTGAAWRPTTDAPSTRRLHYMAVVVVAVVVVVVVITRCPHPFRSHRSTWNINNDNSSCGWKHPLRLIPARFFQD